MGLVEEDEAWVNEDYTQASSIERGISFIARIFTGVIKIAKVIITPVLYFIGGLLMFNLLISWMGLSAGAFFVAPHMDYLTYGPDYLGYVALTNAVLMVGLPILIIVLSITKYIFKFRVSKGITASLIVFAVINFFSLASIVGNAFKDFQVNSSQNIAYDGQLPDSDTIRLHFPRSSDLDGGLDIHFGDMATITNNELSINDVAVNLKKSTDNKLSIQVEKGSKGNNSVIAETYLNQIDMNIRTEGNDIYIPEYYALAKGAKYRAQFVNVTLNVPAGKVVVFDKKSDKYHLNNVDLATVNKRDFKKGGVVWNMTDTGLISNNIDTTQEEDPNKLTISLSTSEGLSIDVSAESDN